MSPTDAQLGQSCGLSSEEVSRPAPVSIWIGCFFFFMNRENQAQETLHPLNDDITKESNPKNLSVPADNQSNGMLNSCTVTAAVEGETTSSLKMRDVHSPLVFETAAQITRLMKFPEENSIKEISRKNTETQSMDSPNGPPLKWATPKNNILNEYYLKL